MIVISAMAPDRAIGARNRMPWHVPEEFEQFLRFVRGNVVIMGRASAQIFEPDLGETTLIVVSRSLAELRNAIVVPSIEEAVKRAEALGKPVFSAGGAQIYAQTVPLADELWLSTIKETEVDRGVVPDAFFPEIDESVWGVAKEEEHSRFAFRVWRRRGASARNGE